ncbi:phage integrase family protein [Mycobacterium xenopi 3993]|nr:phage integrase family protein [Mycobacterium xenopi 3993]
MAVRYDIRRENLHPLSFRCRRRGTPRSATGWSGWPHPCLTGHPRLRRAHLRYTARILGVPTPGDVNTAQLIEVIGAEGRSLEYRRSLRSSLVVFYGWALTSGLVESNPVSGCRKSEQPARTQSRPPTTCGNTYNSTPMSARCSWPGWRVKPVCAAPKSPGALGGSALRRRRPRTDRARQSGKQRIVPITPSLAAAIRAARHAIADTYSRTNRRPHQPRPGRTPGIAGDAARWSMHKLRHRYATRGYAGTGNLRAVQEALGHASVATTQRYTAVSAREIRAVAEAAAHRVPCNDNHPVSSRDTSLGRGAGCRMPGSLHLNDHPPPPRSR